MENIGKDSDSKTFGHAATRRTVTATKAHELQRKQAEQEKRKTQARVKMEQAAVIYDEGGD